jgi:hypothetical protein
MTSVELILTPYELAATVEALHDTLLRRLKWTIYPGHTHWQKLDWDVAHDVIDQLGQAYTKAMMTFRTMDVPQGVADEFFPTFALSDEIWDLLNDVSMAQSWEEAPSHSRHDPKECSVCFKIAHA